MASAQTALPYHTQRTSHSNATSSTVEQPRRGSLASLIPSTRSASQMSHHSTRPSRSPIPPGAGGTGVAYDPDRTSDPSSKSKTPSTGTGVSSQHSSLSGSSAVPMPRYNSEAYPRRRLRSQYPRGSTENHVEYILVASFDIDRGPVMEHQYPVAITGDEHMLAELMLPDQAHMRNQDWTIFFLHKDTSQEEENQEKQARDERKRRRKRRRERAAGITTGDAEDDYDDNLGEDDDDYSDDDESTDSELEGSEGPPLVYVLNLVNTKQDKTVKRGAVVKAMAICTRHPFLHIYKVSRRPDFFFEAIVCYCAFPQCRDILLSCFLTLLEYLTALTPGSLCYYWPSKNISSRQYRKRWPCSTTLSTLWTCP